MKKVFAIAMIATAMVACNNSGKKEGGDTDTTKKDTTTVAPMPTGDTATAPMANDTMPKSDTMPK